MSEEAPSCAAQGRTLQDSASSRFLAASSKSATRDSDDGQPGSG